MNELSTELNYSDVTILIEAIDAWKSRSFAGELMGDLLGAVLLKKDDEEAKRAWEENRAKEKREKEIKQQKDETTATLLKAKLMIMRDKMFEKTISA